MKDFLGVVGGIGPLATTYFMKSALFCYFHNWANSGLEL